MASFTDTISQFNPYIQQLPVEAMTQVGMYKQQKYDEGVQKIQGYVDNIAGLDVIRDIDKVYLQSKLNELGSKLKTVAAGDFSNQQLVNSVGGMATQIVKDPNVQNAVSSTNWYRKQTEKMQKEIEEGKSSPSNIYKFQKQASSWIGSNKLDEKFSDSYIPYFDIDKFTKETFDAVKPDGYTFEQIFATDENGNVKYKEVIDPKTKKVVSREPIYSPVMTRLEQEGRFPKTVRTTIDQIFSNPKVSQQLQITGEYNYRGFSSEDLKGKIIEARNKKLSIYDLELADLNIKKTAGEDVQSQIDDLNTKKQSLMSSYQDVLETADNNPDAIRGMLYKDDTMANYSVMYGTMKEKRTTHENPAWNQMFKMQQEENDQKRFAETMKYNWAKFKQEDDQHKERIRMEMIKLAKAAKPEDEGERPTQGALPSDISLINIEQQTFDNALGKFNSSVKDLVLASGALTDQINQTIQNSGGKLTKEAALERISKQNAAKLGMSSEAYTDFLYRKAIQHISSKGADVPANLLVAKTSAENAYSNFNKIWSIRKDVDKQLGENPMLKAIENLKTQTATVGDKTLQLSPQDQYDIAMAYAGSDWYESAEVKAEAKASKERLEKKGITKDIASTIIDDMKFSRTEYGGSLSQNYFSLLKDIEKLVDNVDKKENIVKLKDRADVLKSFYQLNPTLEMSVLTGKNEIDEKNSKKILNYIGGYQSLGNESAGFSENATKMANIASGKDKGSMKIVGRKNEVTGDVTPAIAFTDENGSFAGEMTIGADQASSLGFDLSQWWKDSKVKVAQSVLQATGNGTTSHSGRVNDLSTYVNNDALYSKSDEVFSNLRGMPDDVKANVSSQSYIDANGNASTLYFGHLFVRDEKGVPYFKTIGRPTESVEEIIQIFQGHTPQMIQAIKADSKNIMK